MTEQTRLIVLGLLTTQPMHGYEIRKQLDLARMSQWTDVAPGSVYHALRKMTSENLLVMDGTESIGNRTRAIYSITEAGHEEFKRLLREAWITPPQVFPSITYLALLFRHHLPSTEVKEYVQYLEAQLRQLLREWQIGEESKQANVEPGFEITFQNGRNHIDVNLNFLKEIKKLLYTESAP